MPTNNWLYDEINRWRSDAVDAPRDTPLVRLTGGNDTRPRVTVPTREESRPRRTTPRRTPAEDTPPVRYTGGDYTYPVQRQQAPAPRPVAPPRSTYSVDPLKAAINRWQQSNRPETVQYEEPQYQFDYEVERPDTGPSAFTAQQYRPPTVASQTPVYDPNEPSAPPQGMNAWLPNRYSFVRPVAGSMVANAALGPQARQTAWNLLGTAWDATKDEAGDMAAQAWAPFQAAADGWSNAAGESLAPFQAAVDGWRRVGDDYRTTAAYDRAQFDINERNQAYDEKYGEGGPGGVRTTLSDYWNATLSQNSAEMQNRQAVADAAMGWWEGDTNLPGAIKAAYDNSSLSPLASSLITGVKYLTPFGAEVAPYTEGLGKGAMNVADTIEGPAVYAYSNVDVPWSDTGIIPESPLDNQPASVAIASFADIFGENLSTFYDNPIDTITGNNDEYKWWGDFVDAWMNQAEKYVEGVTPTPEQLATNTPEELRNAEQLAEINTLGGLESRQESFDYHANKNSTINELDTAAWDYLQAAAATEDPELRQEYQTLASEAGQKAEVMRNEHPQEANRRFTNIERQLLFEILLPDATDLVGMGWQAMGLTPRLRRMAQSLKTAETPAEKVVAELAKMVITPENATDIAAETSKYNKAWNLWTTGTSRATIATDRIRRYIVPLLSEVETAADAKTLLYYLATDPQKLIAGIDGRVFQSSSVLFRMDDDGLVRFGLSGLEKDKEALRIFQQASPGILDSPTLDGPLLHRPDFMADYTDQMNNAGYRYYNVARQADDVPEGTVTGRIRTTTKNQGVVEFIGPDKKLISTSKSMSMDEARTLKASIGQGGAQMSLLAEIGAIERSIVSLPYLVLNPGAYVTNTLGGLATAYGDGDFAMLTKAYIKGRYDKLYGGVSPTLRGEGYVNPSSAEKMYSGRITDKIPGLKTMRKLYSNIDETFGGMTFTHSADTFLLRSKPVFERVVSPILQGAGITDAKEIKRITNHLFETAYQGGDVTAEFNKVVQGQTRIFSLSDANESWIRAIPYSKQEELYNIVRTSTDSADLAAKIDTWADGATRYWDELIATDPKVAQRYSWLANEEVQNLTDLELDGRMAVKRGGIPQAEVDAALKVAAEAAKSAQEKLTGLISLVASSKDPKNRFALYGIWAQAMDYTSDVRVKLAHLAEDAYGFPFGSIEGKEAWEKYWRTAVESNGERNARVNKLMDDTSAALARGDDLTPSTNALDALERTAKINEEPIWKTLKLEPESGRWDSRLGLTIEAGRMIADKATARAFAAAQRFLSVDAMDYIVSTEHAVQMAGGRARVYLDKILDEALDVTKKTSWREYFAARNEVWRQLRVYEKDIWGIAERNIVTDGLRKEGGDVDALLRKGEAVGDMSAAEQGIPVAPGRAPQKVDEYLAQNAEALPFDAEAEKILGIPQSADEYLRMLKKGTVPPNELIPQSVLDELDAAPAPGSAALREAEGLRAERAAMNMEAEKGGRDALRAEWDRVAGAEGGYLSLDAAVRSYVRKGIANVPENKFEDLYGTVIAGRRIDSQADVERFIQEYYDTGTQRRQATQAAAQRPSRDVPVEAAPVAPAQQSRFITSIELGKAMEEADAPETGISFTRPNKGLGDAAREIENHLAQGGEVVLHYTSDETDVRIVRQYNGMVYDEIGQGWGLGSLAFDRNGSIEFIPPVAAERLSSVDVTLTDIRRLANEAGIRIATNAGQPMDKRLVRTINKDLGTSYRGMQEIPAAEYPRIMAALEARKAPSPDDMVDYEFGMPVSPALRKQIEEELNLAGTTPENLASDVEKLSRATTALGGAVEGDVSQGAQFAKLQIQNAVDYVKSNAEQILTPSGRMANNTLPQQGFFRPGAAQGTALGEGSALDAVNRFRREVTPAWDNLKRGAAEYGDKMRSYSFVDFANTTRLDEIMGLAVPYGFWMTRSVKNAAERAIFQPQIWRRVMQADKAIRAEQDQDGAPERYEGSYPMYTDANGVQRWIRTLPSKYWPTFGIFTMNDYADPDSANTAMGFADESMRAANLSTYPWIGAATKIYEGKWDEEYPMNYFPQTRLLAGFLAIQFGPEVPSKMFPGWHENTVSRNALNMHYRGTEIDGVPVSKNEALLVMQLVYQKRNDSPDIPELSHVDAERLQNILEEAHRISGWQDFQAAASSFLTGFTIKPYDTIENEWRDEQGKYYNNAYGPDNQYGSYAAKQDYRDAGMLTQAKAAVTNPDKRSPGEIYSTEAKREEREAIEQTLRDETDKFITNYEDPKGKRDVPSNFEIDKFKNQWMAGNYDGDAGDFFPTTMKAYLDKKYPSATTFEGEFTYEGYAPEEIKQKAQASAYYRAAEELKSQKDALSYPTINPETATPAQWDTYWAARKTYDADKLAYETAVAELTQQYMNDPQIMRELTGRAPQIGPQGYMESIMEKFQPLSLDNVFGTPVRPIGDGEYNVGLVPFAGDPENAEELIKQEKTKGMSDLEKMVREENAAKASSNSNRGGRGYSYSGGGRRGYSRRGGRGSRRRRSGGGGGGSGGSYYVPQVESRGLSEWLYADPPRAYYEAPRTQQRLPDIGPEAIKAWRPISWK